MTAEDIEAIERATLAAVAPLRVEETEGWLLPFDSGTVGRAKSAVPLRHAAPASGLVAASPGAPADVDMAPGHGWASLHGMRTEQSARGRGLAARVMAGLAQAALQRGFERVFLQVEAGNPPALALYRRAGFSPAWRYEYWTPGPPPPAP